jgi:hypothetical protein
MQFVGECGKDCCGNHAEIKAERVANIADNLIFGGRFGTA